MACVTFLKSPQETNKQKKHQALQGYDTQNEDPYTSMGNKQNTLNTAIKHKNTNHHPVLQPATAEKQARQAGHRNGMMNTQGDRERARKNERFQNRRLHTSHKLEHTFNFVLQK